MFYSGLINKAKEYVSKGTAGSKKAQWRANHGGKTKAGWIIESILGDKPQETIKGELEKMIPTIETDVNVATSPNIILFGGIGIVVIYLLFKFKK